MHHYYLIMIVLTAISFIAGFIDTLAGGGGLITVPALLVVGLPPAVALGTNKFQACVGEVNASIHFIKKKRIDFKRLTYGLIFTGIGTTAGTILVQIMHQGIARKIIPVLLLVVILYTIFSPKVKDQDVQARLSDAMFFPIFGLLIGFYNGFLGPGTGSFWVFVLMLLLGLNIVNATMYAKPLNFMGNFLSLIWFIVGGSVYYSLAIAMSVGQLAGSKLGAHMVITKGRQLIRPLYLTMVIATMVVLLLREYGSSLVT